MNLFESLQMMKESIDIELENIITRIQNIFHCDVDDVNCESNSCSFVVYNITDNRATDIEDVIMSRFLDYDNVNVSFEKDNSYLSSNVKSAYKFNISLIEDSQLITESTNDDFVKQECEKYGVINRSYGTNYKMLDLEPSDEAATEFTNKIEADGYKLITTQKDGVDGDITENDVTLVYGKEVENNRCIIAVSIHPSENSVIVSCGYDEEDGAAEFFESTEPEEIIERNDSGEEKTEASIIKDEKDMEQIVENKKSSEGWKCQEKDNVNSVQSYYYNDYTDTITGFVYGTTDKDLSKDGKEVFQAYLYDADKDDDISETKTFKDVKSAQRWLDKQIKKFESLTEDYADPKEAFRNKAKKFADMVDVLAEVISENELHDFLQSLGHDLDMDVYYPGENYPYEADGYFSVGSLAELNLSDDMDAQEFEWVDEELSNCINTINAKINSIISDLNNQITKLKSVL